MRGQNSKFNFISILRLFQKFGWVHHLSHLILELGFSGTSFEYQTGEHQFDFVFRSLQFQLELSYCKGFVSSQFSIHSIFLLELRFSGINQFWSQRFLELLLFIFHIFQIHFVVKVKVMSSWLDQVFWNHFWSLGSLGHFWSQCCLEPVLELEFSGTTFIHIPHFPNSFWS